MAWRHEAARAAGPWWGRCAEREVDVAAEAVTGLSADLASLPSWTLDEGQLADLEMLLSGAFAPLTGFMTAADVASVCESGTLADGTVWPVPVTLDVREDAVPPTLSRLALNDPEGVPLAVPDTSERPPPHPPPQAPARPGRRVWRARRARGHQAGAAERPADPVPGSGARPLPAAAADTGRGAVG